MRILKLLLLKHRARRMRHNPTYTEAKAQKIFDFLHIKYVSQKVIYPYIVDFCIGHIVLELDGHSHDWRDTYDDERSSYLHRKGYEVYRLYNWDVNMKSLQEFIQLTKTA